MVSTTWTKQTNNSTDWSKSSPNTTNWTKSTINSVDWTKETVHSSNFSQPFAGTLLMNDDTITLASSVYNLLGQDTTDAEKFRSADWS